MRGIRELARHLDLSIGTVSKALNGRTDINALTKARVLQAAAEFGYVANQSGRSLRSGSTQTVGFKIESNQAAPTDSDSFFMEVLDGMQLALRKHRLDVIVFPCASDEEPGSYLTRIVARGLVDAMVISATRKMDARVPLLLAANIPFVTLGRSEGPDHAWIELDFEGVAERSVNRLVTRGHRDIAVALPANDLNLGNLFLAGYRKALQAHGIAFRPDWAIRTESSEQGGYRLGTELLSLEQRPTAVMLSYEQPAGGLYRRLNESDLPPGPGIAVIGFRDSQQTRHLVPRLTSFTTSLKDLGMALGETLLSRMPATAKEYADWPPTMIWPLTLVPGDSDPFLNPGAR